MPPRETDRMRNRIAKYLDDTPNIPDTAYGNTDYPKYVTPDDLRTQRIMGYYKVVPEPASGSWDTFGKWFILISATIGWITIVQKIIKWTL